MNHEFVHFVKDTKKTQKLPVFKEDVGLISTEDYCTNTYPQVWCSLSLELHQSMLRLDIPI